MLTDPSGGFGDHVSHSFCKLLVTLGEQYSTSTSCEHHIKVTVSPLRPTRLYLAQAYFRVFLSHTGLPGYASIDEEESEMSLAYW